ncbi:MAG: hypothetical protein ACRDJP_10450 [Actinomycetota bacterium]
MRTSTPTRLVLVLALATLGSCGLLEDAKKVGVSPEGGGLRIHFAPCPGETVTRVAMLTNVGTGISTYRGGEEPGDPDDDEIVEWQVAAPSGSTLTEFDVGTTPSGFTEEIRLAEPVSSYDSVAVFIGYRAGEELAAIQIGFDTENLESGKIYSVDGAVDPEVFRQNAAASCE